MTEASAKPTLSKGRILAVALADTAVDLLLPTAIYALLAPTHLPAVIRVTIGGYFVAAKAGAGHLGSQEGVDDGAAHDAGERRGGFLRTFAVGIAIAVVATAVSVGGRAAGLSDTAAIAAGTILLALLQGASLLRHRRKLDGFALLVLLELGATIILTSVSNSPRFILVRPSFYTAIAGFYVLSTLGTKRPFMMRVTKPMAMDGDPVRGEAFERAGRESLRFRRAEQGMTAGLGLVLLAEAALRVWTVWSHPQNDVIVSSLQSQALGIGLFVIWFAVIRLVFVPIASREVDALMPAREQPGGAS